MKNQYVGDINDYRKYGLLRVLTAFGEHRLAVCWMLTQDDGQNDGQRTAYLREAQRWRKYDPALFDALHDLVERRGTRAVAEVEGAAILPRAWFHGAILSDVASERRAYMRECFDLLDGADLAFFDPDNGLEVPSAPYGTRNSAKYLYWEEIEAAYRCGPSLLIYQHFPRVARARFVSGLATQLMERTKAHTVYSFATSHVVFLLAAQPRHESCLERQAHEAAEQWRGQITLGIHRDAELAASASAAPAVPLCPFCSRIASGDVTAVSEHAVAFPDGFPVSRGHTLVVPRRHVPSVYDLTEAEQADVWRLAARVRARLAAELAPAGFNVGLNDGPAAGQTVPHAHVHVIPRYEGDVPDPRGGVRWVIPERAPYWLER